MDSTTPLINISPVAVLLGIILMVGSVRGAILLLQDAKKHKKFAKIIRIISGSVQLAAIVGSIIITLILLSNMENIGLATKIIINVLLAISMIAIVTNTRGAILLFIQSSKAKRFKKWIRIICGILMIISLFSSFVTGI